MRLRLARSAPEAYLYMARQPCEACGMTGFQSERSASEIVDGTLTRRYEGACGRCGAVREFVFRVPDEGLAAVTPEQGFGDSRPSELLDPGEWLEMADGILARIPESPAGLTDAQRRAAYADLDAGAAALEEVLKFVPAGADAVSPFAFWTERGRRFSLDSRWRFNAEGLRDSLAQVRAAQRSFSD
ncbi:hypothetical protein [Actinoallomurus iriomotensis]|uniref:Uncharacterized protein n=1 Tax=Actinoallomurus iriomotensis TaxID=478107 RepID=A0A9W6RXC1_9ACTN|nr:hypothetical protein [Actinoallomurus iriomotensis]GLY83234.1 hypothetical protein Airi02_011640 [Actinoallomurus iriomotensis]